MNKKVITIIGSDIKDINSFITFLNTQKEKGATHVEFKYFETFKAYTDNEFKEIRINELYAEIARIQATM